MIISQPAKQPLSVALALFAATGACAPQSIETGGVRWAKAPLATTADYPKKAMHDAISGRVEIRCRVANTPEPKDCVVQAENPENHGFGQAALNIVERARFDTASIRPEDVGTTIVVTVPFSTGR
ncbi:MAG: energy transducer TonB [Proteobacteria bacterium]|nr:energy transducer TonB [Pseudomonadota bacterium]